MLSKKIIWKLNIIDLLLLAVILLSICALIYKATWGGSDDEHRIYEVSYVCENVPIEILNGLTEGMECSDYASGSDLGVFKRVEYEPISDKAINREVSASPVPTEQPTHARAVITTEADGVKAEHGVKIDGTVLLKALKLDLIVGDTVLNVYVNEVK